MFDRRGFLSFLGTGVICAPAIVRAASIMPVRSMVPVEPLFEGEIGIYNGVLLKYRKEIIRDYVRNNLFQPHSVSFHSSWRDDLLPKSESVFRAA